jgi:hypothetical protein
VESGRRFGLEYFSAGVELGVEMGFSWSEWPHASLGSGGFWVSGAECREALLRALG